MEIPKLVGTKQQIEINILKNGRSSRLRVFSFFFSWIWFPETFLR
jgi:hypothetical protein